MKDFRPVYRMLPWLLVWVTQLRAHELATVAPPAPRLHFRQPVALVTSGDRLFVANRRSGSLSRIDMRTWDVLSEKLIGRSLSDLAVLGGDRLLAIDEVAGEAVVLREHTGQVWIDQRIDVATSPVSVVVSRDTGTASVASLWARRLTLLRTQGGRIATDGTIDLPFAPRLQCFLPDGRRLVVADAFGGRLAIVDTESKRLVAVRSIEAHNIRGLVISPDGQQLLIVHQMLTSSVPTTRQRVFWGQVISNLLRSVSLEELLDGGATPEGTENVVRPIAHWSLEPLGESKNAAGDPGAILVAAAPRHVICLSGVHQIAIARDPVNGSQRIDVGHRPTALAMDLRQGRIYVANTQDDSISVVDVKRQEVVKTIILGRTPELSIADRGERLFHDARLTLDGWYSCHSCHTDGHSNGQLNDNFGDDEIGTPKRVLSLLGVNSTGPWGWNGHQLWINTQVVKSIRTTMQNDAVEEFAVDGGVAAITDYLRSFEPPPSLLVARGEPIDTPKIARGREVFARFDCGRCHAPPVYTTAQVYDVGLEDEVGQVEFNPPSLRGVSQRAAWLHDNRAQRLSDVFTTYGHPHESTFDLSADDIDALVQFLNTL